MTKTIDKAEVLNYASTIVPDMLKVDVIQIDDTLSLRLSWKDYPATLYQDQIILMQTDDEYGQETYNFAWRQIKEKIKKCISEFGKDECDNIINKFGLSDIYREQYRDKNIMYKVKHKYKRKLDGHVLTKNLSFYYYDQIKISLPSLYYLWILIVTHRFNHYNMEGITDMTYSIMEHLKQLYFTLDIIKDVLTCAKHYGNPDTFFTFYYHFTIFISLVKTIGDNLAWIFKNISWFRYEIL